MNIETCLFFLLQFSENCIASPVESLVVVWSWWSTHSLWKRFRIHINFEAQIPYPTNHQPNPTSHAAEKINFKTLEVDRKLWPFAKGVYYWVWRWNFTGENINKRKLVGNFAWFNSTRPPTNNQWSNAEERRNKGTNKISTEILQQKKMSNDNNQWEQPRHIITVLNVRLPTWLKIEKRDSGMACFATVYVFSEITADGVMVNISKAFHCNAQTSSSLKSVCFPSTDVDSLMKSLLQLALISTLSKNGPNGFSNHRGTTSCADLKILGTRILPICST